MANILEICLSDLITKKNLLEGELESIVNSPNIGTKTKYDKTMEILNEIGLLYNSINLLNMYITKNKNEEN
jgi:hypothetical protein